MPVENLLTPDYLRRVCWRPPVEPSEEGIAEELANLGARQWQIELVAPLITEAFQNPQPLPVKEARSVPAATAAAAATPAATASATTAAAAPDTAAPDTAH